MTEANPLRPERMTEAEFARGDFRALVSPGIELSDVMKSEFWNLVAGRFRRGDMIEVLDEGITWYARLVVASVDRTERKVEMRKILYSQLVFKGS